MASTVEIIEEMNTFALRFDLGVIRFRGDLTEEDVEWINRVYTTTYKKAKYVRGLLKETAWQLYETTFRHSEFVEVMEWKKALNDLKISWMARPKTLKRRKVKEHAESATDGKSEE